VIQFDENQNYFIDKHRYTADEASINILIIFEQVISFSQNASKCKS